MTSPDSLVVRDVPAGEGPLIGLHLLVKNGESVVGRLLSCVGRYLTEVVAVLDRCEDDTAGVLQDACRQLRIRCELHYLTTFTRPDLYFRDVPEAYRAGEPFAGEEVPGPFTGDLYLASFAAARNAGWYRGKADWRLVLDADDHVRDPACLPGLCLALEEASLEAASADYLRRGKISARERLAIGSSSCEWEGAAHEHLVGCDPAKVGHVTGSLLVEDLADSCGAGLRPPGRNLKALYRDARLRDWKVSPHSMLHLALEARRPMPTLAICLAEAYLDLPGEPADRRALAAAVAGEVYEDAGAAEVAVGWYERAMSTCAGRSVAARLARVRHALGLHDGAVAAYEAGLAASPSLSDPGADHEDAVGILVASSYAALGKLSEAESLIIALTQRYPHETVLQEMLHKITSTRRSG